ncbi:helix-turn-helix domain-containing protein [Actinomadura yumaensis]|uniref:Helix-turn-helix domain-containing protein n=1 Tax=Actinomadura yumaensis TaxID=111807 RepID=A0ABW2CS88_9ACTN
MTHRPSVTDDGHDSPFLTPAEVAVLLRVSPETVSKWAKQGRLDGVRTPGGRWRFRREVIAAFLAQQ